MVNPATQNPQGNHEGGRDAAQGLVEIGGLLLCNLVQHVPQPRPCGRTDAVEITDHRHRLGAQGQGAVRPPVGGHHDRRPGPGPGQVARGNRPAGHQRDPGGGIDNRLIHADTVLD